MIINDIQCVEVDASLSSKALKLAIKEIEGEYFFLKTCLAEIDWLPGAVDRMLQVADFVNANMIYSIG